MRNGSARLESADGWSLRWSGESDTGNWSGWHSKREWCGRSRSALEICGRKKWLRFCKGCAKNHAIPWGRTGAFPGNNHEKRTCPDVEAVDACTEWPLRRDAEHGDGVGGEFGGESGARCGFGGDDDAGGGAGHGLAASAGGRRGGGRAGRAAVCGARDASKTAARSGLCI